jgi:hygromycin-B 4-O-kinase
MADLVDCPVEPGPLLDRVMGCGVRSLTPIAGGAWSRAWSFSHDGRSLVLRISRLEEDFAKDDIAARYASPTLPVPAILARGRAGTDGYHFCVSERVTGGFLEELTPRDMEEAFPAVLGMLDELRQADISPFDGYGIWRPDGSAAHGSWSEALLAGTNDPPTARTHGWKVRLAAYPRAENCFGEALDVLQSLAEQCSDGRHLVHSDTINRNVFVRNGRISGVIDWGCSLYGDFLYDLAWLSFSAPHYAGLSSVDIHGEAARHYRTIRLEVPRMRERLLCCHAHIALLCVAFNVHTGNGPMIVAAADRFGELVRTA